MDAIMLIEKDKANSCKKGDNIWRGGLIFLSYG